MKITTWHTAQGAPDEFINTPDPLRGSAEAAGTQTRDKTKPQAPHTLFPGPAQSACMCAFLL